MRVRVDLPAMESTNNESDDNQSSCLKHKCYSDPASQVNRSEDVGGEGEDDGADNRNIIEVASPINEETAPPSDSPTVETPACKPPKASRSSRKDITTPEKEDILMGRGPPYQCHPGNQAMRKLIEENRSEYGALPREKKSGMVKQILRKILKSGARFLKRREGHRSQSLVGGWEVAPRADAYEKICHALRSKYRPKRERREEAQRLRIQVPPVPEVPGSSNIDGASGPNGAAAAAIPTGGFPPGTIPVVAGAMFNPALMSPAMMAAFAQQAALMAPFPMVGGGFALPVPVPVPIIIPGVMNPSMYNSALHQGQAIGNLGQDAGDDESPSSRNIPNPSPDQVSSHDAVAVADEAPSSAAIADEPSSHEITSADPSTLMTIGDYMEENMHA